MCVLHEPDLERVIRQTLYCSVAKVNITLHRSIILAIVKSNRSVMKLLQTCGTVTCMILPCRIFHVHRQ